MTPKVVSFPGKTNVLVLKLLVTGCKMMHFLFEMDVSLNGGTPKSSILIGFSIMNHPFWGTTIFGNTQMVPFQWTFLSFSAGGIISSKSGTGGESFSESTQ